MKLELLSLTLASCTVCHCLRRARYTFTITLLVIEHFLLFSSLPLFIILFLQCSAWDAVVAFTVCMYVLPSCKSHTSTVDIFISTVWGWVLTRCSEWLYVLFFVKIHLAWFYYLIIHCNDCWIIIFLLVHNAASLNRLWYH